ncbi:MAG: bifunctional DNA-formamidopyrimidine glycosylase/DNA-(apurinic or apyrimidinic site) lyase [Dehalococcoidia bacterium]|nr:MAG: bifunctional DNA-formamidopyrimidine glycosylase/DNA-(apurinic or apyrimidinic site) lyase [Dehalococcoidia bacterium]
MPELPEVESIKNELLPLIVGRRVSSVTLFWAGIVRLPSVEEFCSRLIGQRLTGVARRGKYLIFSLTSGKALIIHLKMTGSLLLKPASTEPDKFIRAILYLDKEIQLCFRDPRKLGVMWLVEDTNSIVGKLGPEPLEASFTPQILLKRLNNRTAPIKALLCDQTFIAGIGNMYADEALFAARIHPLRSGKSLSQDEAKRLHHSIKRVLLSAIGYKGASVDTYLRPSGELGTAHLQFQVAHRLSGNLCPVCGTLIERIVVRNRGTYFCPQCQPYDNSIYQGV